MKRSGRFPVTPKEQRTADGIVFASKGEMLRYLDLKLLERARQIHDLRLQPKFDFVVNGVKVGSYTGDFRYLTDKGELVIEDTKSSGTRKERDYVMRKKLLKALYGIEVKESGK